MWTAHKNMQTLLQVFVRPSAVFRKEAEPSVGLWGCYVPVGEEKEGDVGSVLMKEVTLSGFLVSSGAAAKLDRRPAALPPLWGWFSLQPQLLC